MLKWLKDFFFGVEEKKPLAKPVPSNMKLPAEKKVPKRAPGIKTRKNTRITKK